MRYALAISLVLATGCISHEVRIEPITIQPIHLTVDVNMHVDRAQTAGGADEPGGDAASAPAPPPAGT